MNTAGYYHLKFKRIWDASCITFNFSDLDIPQGEKQEYFSLEPSGHFHSDIPRFRKYPSHEARGRASPLGRATLAVYRST